MSRLRQLPIHIYTLFALDKTLDIINERRKQHFLVGHYHVMIKIIEKINSLFSLSTWTANLVMFFRLCHTQIL